MTRRLQPLKKGLRIGFLSQKGLRFAKKVADLWYRRYKLFWKKFHSRFMFPQVFGAKRFPLGDLTLGWFRSISTKRLPIGTKPLRFQGIDSRWIANDLLSEIFKGYLGIMGQTYFDITNVKGTFSWATVKEMC